MNYLEAYPYFIDLYHQTSIIESTSIKLISKTLNKFIPGLLKFSNYEDIVLNSYNLNSNHFDLIEPYLDIFQYKKSSLNTWNDTLEKYGCK